MAKPVGFEGANKVFYAPPSMTPEECGDLAVHQSHGQIISCWRFSVEEIEEINRTGVAFLSIVGEDMPPVKVAALETFEQGNPAAEPVLPRARRREHGETE